MLKRNSVYLVNTIHAKLQQLNLTVTFKIGNTVSGGSFISIELEFLAIDLQVSSPIYLTSKNHFTFLWAHNDTQSTA